jgi:hypothetical protein
MTWKRWSIVLKVGFTLSMSLNFAQNKHYNTVVNRHVDSLTNMDELLDSIRFTLNFQGPLRPTVVTVYDTVPIIIIQRQDTVIVLVVERDKWGEYRVTPLIPPGASVVGADSILAHYKRTFTGLPWPWWRDR